MRTRCCRTASQSRVAGRFASRRCRRRRGGIADGGAWRIGAGDQRLQRRLRTRRITLIDYLPRARADARAGARDRRPVPAASGDVRDAGARGCADRSRRRMRGASSSAPLPRPATPVYSELSEILQIALHRALTGQQEPRAALREAATAMRALLDTSRTSMPRRNHDARRDTPRLDARAPGAGRHCSGRAVPDRCGRSGNRCTCTICGCPGSAGPSSAPPTTSRRSAIRGSGARSAHTVMLLPRSP